MQPEIQSTTADEAVELEQQQKLVRFNEDVEFLPDVDFGEADGEDEAQWLSVSHPYAALG